MIAKFNNTVVKTQILGWLNGLNSNKAYRFMSNQKDNMKFMSILRDTLKHYDIKGINGAGVTSIINTVEFKSGAKIVLRYEDDSNGISVALLSSDKNMEDNTMLYHSILQSVTSLFKI